MSDVRKAFGFALLPLCCLGVPLLIAAGPGVAALALIGGITIVAVIAGAVFVLLVVHRARRIGAPAEVVPERAKRS